MRADHLFSVVLIFCIQGILLAIGSAITVVWIAGPYLLLVFVASGAGYIWALHDAPLGLSTSRRTVKHLIVGLAGFGLSLLVFVLSVAYWGSLFRIK
jgi:hypothetical protein